MKFERVVFWSGIWNVGLGLILVTPPIREFLGLQVPNPFWPWIVAAFLWYTAATLILSSRDVRIFASVIYWEALLRVPTILFAVTDFVWGLVYIVGLQRVTGRSHTSLLVDSREHLLEASNLLFRLSFVLFERGPELFALRRLRHLRQRRQDFLLREINILQRVMEQIVKRLSFLRHRGAPLC